MGGRVERSGEPVQTALLDSSERDVYPVETYWTQKGLVMVFQRIKVCLRIKVRRKFDMGAGWKQVRLEALCGNLDG